MGKRDKRFDVYIKAAAPFAVPILEHIRELMHATCPDVAETIKWSHPHYDHHGIMCSMAAFKHHAIFGFWKSSLIANAVTDKTSEAWGSFGRITSVKDLPPDTLIAGFIKQAMRLNEAGVPVQKPKAAKKATAMEWIAEGKPRHWKYQS